MKQFLLIPLCWFFFLNAEAQSPNCVWAKRFFDSDLLSSTGQFAIDAEHNVIMINNRGWQEEIDTTLPAYHISGSFIIKNDSVGHLQWIKRIIGDTLMFQGEVKIWSVKTDADNNVYAYGFFTSSVFIENQTLSSSGASDILLIKYDKNGNLLWAKKMGGQLDDRIAYDGLRVSKEGTIFISGNYAGYFNIINPTPDTIVTTFDTLSIITYDSILTYSFVACFNTNGTVRWLKSLPSGSKKTGVSLPNVDISVLELDKNINVYISGTSDYGIYWDNFLLQQYSIQGITKNFLLKCDSNGNALFSKSIINKSIYGNNYITVDSLNNFYLFSEFTVDTTFIDGVPIFIGEQINTFPGQFQIKKRNYLMKFDATGNLVWIKNFGDVFGSQISLDKDNNLLLFALITNTKTKIESDTIFTAYPYDVLMLKVRNIDGSVIWKKALPNNGQQEYSSFIFADTKSKFYCTISIVQDDSFCIDGYTFHNFYYSIILAKFHQSPTDVESIPFNENTLTLYPNPAHQTITINRVINEPNQLRVIDALGRIVPVNYNIIGNKTEINIASLPVGLYMVLVNDGNDIATAKLMKE